MAKRAKNGGNKSKNGQVLHISQFLHSENRIFWKKTTKIGRLKKYRNLSDLILKRLRHI
jgi:hypothetical protein